MNKLIILAVLLPLALTARAQQPDAALLASCVACHGAQGLGDQALGAPRLAGQGEQYLTRQLQNFRAGRRGYAEQDQPGQQMRSMAASLSDTQIAGLAGYYAALQLARQPVPASAASQSGAALYQATCAACHGQCAQGYPQQQTPDLRILGGWYIDRQLQAFVQGWRGADAHADIRAKWMRTVATQINAEQQRQIVDYIETWLAPQQ